MIYAASLVSDGGSRSNLFVFLYFYNFSLKIENFELTQRVKNRYNKLCAYFTFVQIRNLKIEYWG